MESYIWSREKDPREQLRALSERAREPGLVVVGFATDGPDARLRWRELEPWTRTRAVTVADIRGDLSGPTLEVAVCSDLVYVRSGVTLELGDPADPPGAGLAWGLARAGPKAVARGLLHGGAISAAEAVALGLAQAEVAASQPLPLPEPCSIVALTAARDLMRVRARGGAASHLELATFRFLFATGEPAEGARAFLEQRRPRFGGFSEE